MSSELLGQTLGSRYRFDALLGEGSFAHVYRITDLHRSATLAAKVLRREIAQDTTFIERFRREAVVLARLQHPNIVRYYDTVELEGYTFLLVDYIPGQTFQTVLANQAGPLKPLASLTYLTPLVSALQFAHNEKVIHRDLKPANILIHENGTLLITDFGIARILNTTSELTLGMTVGTPLYMSPEQITGAPVTIASDIYSLGVILYRMYTGVPPFRGESPRTSGSTAAARITYEHVHLPAEPLITLNPGLDLAVQEIVLRCLEKEPRRRFRSVTELYDALAEAIGAPPMSAPTGPTDVPPGMKLPEWSQFMAQPVSPDGTGEQPSDSRIRRVTPRAAIESPIPATKPHLEGELREASARTLVNQGSPDAPPTMSSMGRVPSINRVTLPHQQVSRPPSVSAPAYMAQPPAAHPEKRRGTTYAAAGGAVVVILMLCLAAIYLYLSSNDEHSSSATASATPLPAVTQAETANRIAFDSGRSGNLDIYLLNLDNGVLDQLTGSSGAERGPAWSPDGTMIAFYGAASEEGNYDIFVVNSDKTGIRNLTNSPQADDRYPTWSPDGTRLAFHSNADGDYDLYAINLDGSGLQALTSNDADDLGPDWSPEGSQIAFHSDLWDDTYDIALIDVNTHEVRRLTADDRINSFPTWSPDGKQLAYHAITSEGGAVNLFVMRLADGTVTQLTDGETRNAFPDWSPDGRTLIYQSGQPEVSAIYAIPAVGGTPRPLTDTQSNFLPEWEPQP